MVPSRVVGPNALGWKSLVPKGRQSIAQSVSPGNTDLHNREPRWGCVSQNFYRSQANALGYWLPPRCGLE